MLFFLNNNHWIIWLILFSIVESGILLFTNWLNNMSFWHYMLPLIVGANFLWFNTSNFLHRILIHISYTLLFAIISIVLLSLSHLSIIGGIFVIGFFTMFLKIMVQIGYSNKKLHLHGKIYTSNIILKTILSNYDRNLLSHNVKSADIILCENINHITISQELQKKKIISLDCQSNLLSGYVPNTSINVDEEIVSLDILVITNDEQIIYHLVNYFEDNITIVTDNEELAKKYNCKLYVKSLINDLDTLNNTNIIIDLYMVNIYNIHNYGKIAQELFKLTKNNKVILSVSRFSAFVDVLVPNLFKEILWTKIAHKNPHNIIIPMRTGDIIDNSNYSIFKEIQINDTLICNQEINLTSTVEIINNCFKFIKEFSMEDQYFIYETALNLYNMESLLHTNNIYPNAIQFEQLWARINQIKIAGKANYSYYKFPWLEQFDPIIEKFINTHTNEFNFIELIRIFFAE